MEKGIMLNLNKLDKNSEVDYLDFIDLKGTKVSLGYSRSGYIRFDMEGSCFVPYKHLDSDMHPCLSFCLEEAQILLNSLRDPNNKIDVVEDIYETKLKIFRSKNNIIFRLNYNGDSNTHWNDHFLEFNKKQYSDIINKLEELLKA